MFQNIHFVSKANLKYDRTVTNNRSHSLNHQTCTVFQPVNLWLEAKRIIVSLLAIICPRRDTEWFTHRVDIRYKLKEIFENDTDENHSLVPWLSKLATLSCVLTNSEQVFSTTILSRSVNCQVIIDYLHCLRFLHQNGCDKRKEMFLS